MLVVGSPHQEFARHKETILGPSSSCPKNTNGLLYIITIWLVKPLAVAAVAAPWRILAASPWARLGSPPWPRPCSSWLELCGARARQWLLGPKSCSWMKVLRCSSVRWCKGMGQWVVAYHSKFRGFSKKRYPQNGWFNMLNMINN